MEYALFLINVLALGFPTMQSFFYRRVNLKPGSSVFISGILSPGKRAMVSAWDRISGMENRDPWKSANPSISYVGAVEEAICFGRIGGFKKGMDGDRYTAHFPPRRPKSNTNGAQRGDGWPLVWQEAAQAHEDIQGIANKSLTAKEFIMSDSVIAAIIGALAGSIVSAIATIFATRRQIEAAINEAKGNKTWDIAFAASQVQSEILSVYTPDRVKTIKDIHSLQTEWGYLSRQLYILGEKKASDELTHVIDDYFQALREFVGKKMLRGELEHRRVKARDAVADIMKNYR